MPTPHPLPTTLAFLAGILLTFGFKDFYPDLERRFRRRWRPSATLPAPSSSSAGDVVSLQDRTRSNVGTSSSKDDSKKDGEGKGEFRWRGEGIGDGIESTIGNTPLIRIRSLSEETGCEILGKAEVFMLFICVRLFYIELMFPICFVLVVFDFLGFLCYLNCSRYMSLYIPLYSIVSMYCVVLFYVHQNLKSAFMQFLNGAGQSPKDRVALSIIKTVILPCPSRYRQTS